MILIKNYSYLQKIFVSKELVWSAQLQFSLTILSRKS